MFLFLRFNATGLSRLSLQSREAMFWMCSIARSRLSLFMKQGYAIDWLVFRFLLAYRSFAVRTLGGAPLM